MAVGMKSIGDSSPPHGERARFGIGYLVVTLLVLCPQPVVPVSSSLSHKPSVIISVPVISVIAQLLNSIAFLPSAQFHLHRSILVSL